MSLAKKISTVMLAMLALVSFSALADRECHNCGVVNSVESVVIKGESSGGGAIVGGLVGGLLGNQIGRGGGRSAATVVGAAGGAIAGNEMEKESNGQRVWKVRVDMDYGEMRTFTYSREPDFVEGDRVQVRRGELRLLPED